ncbi:MAG: hypothetical protein LC135_11715 [Phycisphaerae bacterium]|nr:hypothetical protein [Phycisphaerae bacterium]MCZ2400515.1 hypothetical protein [Phycisphaerae bacterium]NUQ49974.1 hypothetical protein [Phycisphaerae bacterium]
MKRWLIGGLVLALGATTAFGQSLVSRTPATLRTLDERIPEVSFQDAPLESVMQWVGETTGINVVVRWQILEERSVDRDKPITIKVKNVRLSQALWMIMNEAGGSEVTLAYRASGNTLILSTADDLNKEMVVKAYDVSDLLVRPQNFAGPQLDLQQASQAQSGGGGGGQSIFQNDQQQNNNQDNQREGQNEGEIQRLIDLITTVIEPDTWEQNGGIGTIRAFRSQLVVRNTIFVHQRLGGFIEEAD